MISPMLRSAACLLAIGLVGCTGRDPNDKTLRIALQDDPKSLDCAIGYSISTWGLYHMLYETLVTYDFDSKVVPALAASWKVEDGGKRYVFTLRDGAKFHDGRPVSSKDVVYSFQRMLDPKTKCPGSSFYESIVGVDAFRKGKAPTIAGVTAPDAKTVQIVLTAPNLVFLQLLAMPFASAVPDGASSDDLAKAPIGSGRMKFGSWQSGQSIKLTRNPDFPGNTPAGPESVEYVLGVNENLEVLKFERGELDLLGVNRGIPAADYAWLRGNPKWTKLMLDAPDAAFYYVTLNCRVPPFDNLKVRRAVAHAIDKARVVKLVNGRGQVAPGILPPPMPGYNKDLQGIPYDPAKAKQLLAEAGFPNGFSNTFYCVNSDSTAKVAQSIQQDLGKVGIKLDLKALAFPSYLDAKATPGRVAIGSGNWSQDFPDPSNFLTTMFSSKNIKPTESLNDSYYTNPKVDALLDGADVEGDTQKRLKLYQEAEALIVADAPVVPLYYPLKVQMHAERVHGYKLHPIWGVELAGVEVK
ncbi:MAG: peptide transporter substrate-binding protein [Cyanobacteria bacterium RYN_339]|nr:peptide transporter substrate-binding protein [Cyanobacteria bacterium RYN_339]